MKKSLRKIVFFVAAFAFIASMSSCNRGVGCPSNFSLDSGIVDAVKTVLEFLF